MLTSIEGWSPYRYLVVRWVNVSNFGPYESDPSKLLNFDIRLYEYNDDIEFYYYSAITPIHRLVTIGLQSTTNAVAVNNFEPSRFNLTGKMLRWSWTGQPRDVYQTCDGSPLSSSTGRSGTGTMQTSSSRSQSSSINPISPSSSSSGDFDQNPIIGEWPSPSSSMLACPTESGCMSFVGAQYEGLLRGMTPDMRVSINQTAPVALFDQGADDEEVAVSIPWNHTIYGMTTTRMFVSTNGWVGFGHGSTKIISGPLPIDSSNRVIQGSLPIIAFLMADLIVWNPYGTANVTFRLKVLFRASIRSCFITLIHHRSIMV
jgi:hypothetical protein